MLFIYRIYFLLTAYCFTDKEFCLLPYVHVVTCRFQLFLSSASSNFLTINSRIIRKSDLINNPSSNLEISSRNHTDTLYIIYYSWIAIVRHFTARRRAVWVIGLVCCTWFTGSSYFTSYYICKCLFLCKNYSLTSLFWIFSSQILHKNTW